MRSVLNRVHHPRLGSLSAPYPFPVITRVPNPPRPTLVFHNPFDHGVVRNLTRFWLRQRNGPRRYTLQGNVIDSAA